MYQRKVCKVQIFWIKFGVDLVFFKPQTQPQNLRYFASKKKESESIPVPPTPTTPVADVSIMIHLIPMIY